MNNTIYFYPIYLIISMHKQPHDDYLVTQFEVTNGIPDIIMLPRPSVACPVNIFDRKYFFIDTKLEVKRVSFRTCEVVCENVGFLYHHIEATIRKILNDGKDGSLAKHIRKAAIIPSDIGNYGDCEYSKNINYTREMVENLFLSKIDKNKIENKESQIVKIDDYLAIYNSAIHWDTIKPHYKFVNNRYDLVNF